MPKTVEFWFDFGSPAAFLAWKRLPALAQRSGATIDYRPMLLGGVFKSTGNRSPVEVASKGKWMHQDLEMWAREHGTPYRRNPHFPINTLTLMRGAVGFQMKDPAKFQRYCDAVYDAIWVDGRNMNDANEVSAVLGAIGIDGEAFMALVNDPEVKEALKQRTEEAVARGVFGAPTFFVGERMFWGQDRMDFVEKALRG